VDHFLPVTSSPNLALEYDNLLYACISCNLSKGSADTPDPLSNLLHPIVQVSEDGGIDAATPAARKLVEVLGLNRPRLREFRELWVRIIRLAALHDPSLFQRLMGYPADLPDLAPLRPPQGNTRPEGIAQSHFARRQRGELPDTY
jgi:hypothetical protein